jgi:predicted  nucleic acid-binding Zn-ribbon protein
LIEYLIYKTFCIDIGLRVFPFIADEQSQRELDRKNKMVEEARRREAAVREEKRRQEEAAKEAARAVDEFRFH